MAQRDYILRLIEQMGQALIALRNRILGRKASPEQVTAELEKVAAQTGIDLDLTRSASPETLVMLVAPTGEVEPGRCWLVAEMVGLDGLQCEVEGRHEEAAAAYRRAHALFSLLEPGGAFLVGFPEARERLDDLESRLERLDGGGQESPAPGEADPTLPGRPIS